MASMPASLNIAKYRFRVQMSNCRVRSIHSGDLTVAGPRYGDGEISSKCHVGNGQGDTTSKIIPLLGFECRESCSERGTLLTGVAALPSPPFGKLARTFSAFVPCGGPSNFLTRGHGLACHGQREPSRPRMPTMNSRDQSFLRRPVTPAINIALSSHPAMICNQR